MSEKSKLSTLFTLKGMLLSTALSIGAIGGVAAPDTAHALSNAAQRSLYVHVDMREGTLRDIQSNHFISSGARDVAVELAPSLTARGFEPTFIDNLVNRLGNLSFATTGGYLPSAVRAYGPWNGNLRAEQRINRILEGVQQVQAIQNIFRHQEYLRDQAIINYHNSWLSDERYQSRRSFETNRATLDNALRNLNQKGEAAGTWQFHPLNNNALMYTQRDGSIGYLVIDGPGSVLKITNPAVQDAVDNRSTATVTQALQTEFADPRRNMRPSNGLRPRRGW